MIFNYWEEEYRSPRCFVICLKGEADICNGTNTPGAGDYDDDEELGDI